MMRRVLQFTLALLLTQSLLASPPPVIPPSALPPAVPGGSAIVQAPPLPKPDPAGPMTLARLDNAGLSGVLYYAMLERLQGATATAAPEAAKSGAHLYAGTNANVVGAPFNATNDNFQDIEPTVTAVNFNGVMHTTTVSIKYLPTGLQPPLPPIRSHLFAVHTTNFGTPPSPGVELPIPPGYTWAGDPLMAVNPSISGIAARRMYCSGLVFKDDENNQPSAIAVWHSDDGGQSWSNAAIAASVAGGGSRKTNRQSQFRGIRHHSATCT
jgi:hypothetical protein